MGSVEVFGFEEGRRRMIEEIEAARLSPVLVGVYGFLNSGKTYLIESIGEYFRSRGKRCACYGGAPFEAIFERIRDSPEVYGDTQLFHCAWERIPLPDGRSLNFDQDPGVFSKDILRRDLDLIVGIYNPKYYKEIAGDYDFIISNPDSFLKPSLLK